MSNILIYSHDNDPVVKTIKAAGSTANILCVSVNDILDTCIIYDEIEDGNVHLHWELPGNIIIENKPDNYIINRVLFLPEELFDKFHEEDRKYAYTEFTAYMLFALDSFPSVMGKPGPFGIDGNKFSLPRQWNMVKDKLQICIPDYYIGDLKICPFKDDKNIVLSLPYNYYYWKPGQVLHNPETSSFAFIRPSGKPVIASVLGKSTHAFPYFEKDVISQEGLESVESCSNKIAEIFDYKICESMFFYDEDGTLTYGMSSNIPYVAEKKPWFSEALFSLLNEESHAVSHSG